MPLTFSSLGERSQKKRTYSYVHCSNTEGLSVNLMKHIQFRSVSVSSAARITLPICRSGQRYIDLTVAEYLFGQRLTLPFINGRGECQTRWIRSFVNLGEGGV
jgi:hypothetical protein